MIGIIGNVLSFAVWSRKRMRVSSSSVSFRFLAVIDTCVLLIAPLRELILYASNLDIQEINDLSCRLHNWLAFSVTSLSAWIMSAMSIDRLVSVKYPLWAKSYCTKKLAFVIGAPLTTVVVLLNSHVLFYLNRKEIFSVPDNSNKTFILDVSCLPDSEQMMVFWKMIWPAVILVLFSFGPILCLIICSVILVRELSARTNNIGSNKQRYHLKPLTKMLVALCLCFIIISVPVCTYLIVSPYIFDISSLKHIALTRLTWAIVALFLYCNNSFNFVLYYLSGKMFRKELHLMFIDWKSSILQCLNRRTVPEIVHSRTTTRTSAVKHKGSFIMNELKGANLSLSGPVCTPVEGTQIKLATSFISRNSSQDQNQFDHVQKLGSKLT